MKMVVIDLELTQPKETIIEIGAVSIDLATSVIMSEYQNYIYSTEPISEFITQLTGITREDVLLRGQVPSSGYALFWNWFKDQKAGRNLAAWGTDCYELARASKNEGVQVPRFYSHNIKSIAAFIKRAKFGAKAKGGLRETLNQFGFEKYEYRQHRALEDAKAAAYLASYLFKELQKYWKIKEIANGS